MTDPSAPARARVEAGRFAVEQYRERYRLADSQTALGARPGVRLEQGVGAE